MSTRVSVILPVYNGERYVAEALNSSLAQTHRDIEIVIVDDGSTDNGFAKIEPYLKLPQIKFVEQRNGGVAAARNAGIRNSTGEIVAFLDQDDLWLPDKLAMQVDYLARHPTDQLVHGYQLYVGADGQRIDFAKDWVAPVSGYCFRELFLRNRIAVLTVAVRRSCLDQVGAFDEKVSRADDYELWLRIAKQFSIGFIAQPLGYYRVHNANTSKDSFSMEVAELNAVDAFLRRFPDARREIGASRVRQRLFELNFSVGSWYMWQEKNHRIAKPYFLRALKNRPMRLSTAGRIAWCSLSGSQRTALHWYYHRARILLRLPNW